MKNVFLFIIAILALASCEKRSPVDEQTDKWNGYEKFLKVGEETHPLLAGANKQIAVGTVTYGIDDNANFYVTYNITSPGYKMTATSMYCGDKKHMPLNKAKNPRIDRFPYKKCHNPRVTTYTIRVPLTSLPPAEFPGFVVASHCVVTNPVKCNEQTKNCWADGDFAFTDKDWGWYDVFYYNQPENPYTILYGTTYTEDSLSVYHLNMTKGIVTLILREFVGNTSGTYDGTAFDVDSSMFFFVNYNTRELLLNRMNDTLPSFSAGYLNGTAASGTYYNHAFYYVNADFNTINKVTFTSNWMKASETVLDTIPNVVTVNDIAMSPDGNNLFIIGEVDGGNTEMIKWAVAADVYYTISLNMDDGLQIAYGSDGNLYAIAPVVEGGSTSSASIVNPNTGVLTEIDEGHIIIIDAAFTDLSRGPNM
jgi:hypothetical protein